MTVSTTATKVNQTGDGANVNFTFTFKALAAGDVEVYLDSVLVSSSLYTVNLNSDQDASPGGTVVMNTAPALNVVHTILRVMAKTQSIVYTAYDPFPAKSHEGGLDNAVLMIQENTNTLQDVVKPPLSDDGSTNYTMPAYDTGKAIIWDDPTKKLINSTDTFNNIVTDAAASAAAALVSEGNASTSATNSANSATASSTSAAAALVSENAADATLKDFQTRYLGALASDPTLDLEGNALIVGATYWNTTLNIIRVYDGAIWQNESIYLGLDDSSTGPVLTLTDSLITSGVPLTVNGAFTSLGIDDNASSTVLTLTDTLVSTPVNFTVNGNTVLGNATTDTLNVGNGDLIKDASGNVGIGVNPDNELHVHRGSAGSVVSSGNALITLENSATAYFQFLTPNNAQTGFFFGDPESNAAGRLLYNHSDDTLNFYANSANKLQIGSAAINFLVNTNYGNNIHSYWGTGNDLDIYYNGAGAFIENNGGEFTLNQKVNTLDFQIVTRDSGGITRNGIVIGGATPNVKLYYNGSEVFHTYADGGEVGTFSQTGAISGVNISNSGRIDTSNTVITGKSQYRFYNPNGLVGSIQTNGTATVYNTSSDKRLKTSHGLLSNSSIILNQIEIHEFHFNTDKATALHGVMAQDCYDIYPSAISKPDNDEDTWSADYSKFVPLLIAHAQDLEKRIHQLEGK